MALSPTMRGASSFLVLLVSGLLASAETADRTYMLVVNGANPVNQLRKEQVATLFLDRSARWGHGVDVEPVDQSTKSPLREAFSQEVLGKTLLAVQAYWQKRIMTEHEVPPPVKASDAEVLAYVAKRKGGIGYVTAGTTLPEGLKGLRLE